MKPYLFNYGNLPKFIYLLITDSKNDMIAIGFLTGTLPIWSWCVLWNFNNYMFSCFSLKVQDRPFTYMFVKSKKTEQFLKRFKFGENNSSHVTKCGEKLELPKTYTTLQRLTQDRKIVSSSLSESEFYVDFEAFDEMLS